MTATQVKLGALATHPQPRTTVTQPSAASRPTALLTVMWKTPRYASFIVLVGVVWGMAEPGEEIAPGASDRSRLRASRADREQVIETLKAAFIQGRLTKDELDLRVGHALGSQTYAELAAVTGDLPAGLAAAQPLQPPWAPGEPAMPRPGLVLTAATVLYAGVWAYAILFPAGGDNDANGKLILVGGFFYLILLLMAGTGVLANWLDKRSGRQPPRRPAAGAGGQVSQHLPSGGAGRCFRLVRTAVGTLRTLCRSVAPARSPANSGASGKVGEHDGRA